MARRDVQGIKIEKKGEGGSDVSKKEQEKVRK